MLPPCGCEAAGEPFEEDGVVYELELSRRSTTGYKNVIKVRGGEFHAKPTPVKGGGQVTLEGPGCKTAREAALRLAKWKASEQPIVKEKKPRAARGQGAKVCRRLLFHYFLA